MYWFQPLFRGINNTSVTDPFAQKANFPPLPKWIIDAYSKENITLASLIQQLDAKKVSDIKQVKVGGIYLVKMPWDTETQYEDAIQKMLFEATPGYKQQLDEWSTTRDELFETKKKHCEAGTQEISNKIDTLREQPDQNKFVAELHELARQIYRIEFDNKKKPDCITAWDQYAHFLKQKPAIPADIQTRITSQYERFRETPILFIKVTEITDTTISFHGYNVTTGMVYSWVRELKIGAEGVKFEYNIDFKDVTLYYLDKGLLELETKGATGIFDRIANKGGKYQSKRRSKTNSAYRKYRSRRNISSRANYRKKTARGRR
jgi:hypothetical protein